MLFEIALFSATSSHFKVNTAGFVQSPVQKVKLTEKAQNYKSRK